MSEGSDRTASGDRAEIDQTAGTVLLILMVKPYGLFGTKDIERV